MTLATSNQSISRRGNGDFDSFDQSDTRVATVEVASTRAAQEVQAAMIVAKKFPRDTIGAYNRIMTTCRRTGLAKEAMYEYPRGGQKVTGPSIRLAEALAQNWGNVDFGIIELEQRDGESTVMSYAWDLETNTRQTKIFTVRHERDKRSGNERLTSQRDIYELVANQGARRLRACILGIIPGDIVDAAVDECEKTLSKASTQGPLIDRIRKMISAFSEMQITQEMIEKKLGGQKAETFSEREVLRLGKIYNSIRDGMSSREDHFEVGGQNGEAANNLSDRIEQGKQQQTKTAAPVAPPPQASGPASNEVLDGSPVIEQRPAADDDQGEGDAEGDKPSVKFNKQQIRAWLVRQAKKQSPIIDDPSVEASADGVLKLLSRDWGRLDVDSRQAYFDAWATNGIPWPDPTS